jgi:exosortase
MGELALIMTLRALRPRMLLSLVVASLAWFEVIRIVQNDWRIDPQYSYGLIVPFLVIGLLLKRREDCPPATLLGGWAKLVTGGLLLASSLLLAGIVPLAEANPDWRPLGLGAGLAAVCITLCLITFRGGIPWLLHYAFAVSFFLIAVPWPRNLEQSVMSMLMSWNTATTVEILHWWGYEALRQGNLIVIPAGVLGIEEACSGIRSLQSGLMVALFFGEVFRVSVIRRLFLLLAALLAALAGNILRSSFLSILASRQGMSAVPALHDLAGFIVLILTITIVFGLAYFWRSKIKIRSLEAKGRSILPASQENFPIGLLSAIVSLLLVSMISTETWFRLHDLPSGGNWGWAIDQRGRAPGVVQVPVAPATLRMLFHPDGFSEKWIGSAGEQGQVFVFQWPAGRTALQSVQMHSPEVCLSSMGMHLEKKLCDFDMGNMTRGLRLHAWLFSQQGRPVYVYHSIFEQDDGAVGSNTPTDQAPLSRFENLKRGKRNRGQRMVEVAFWNLHDETEARAALSRYLAESMTMTPAPFNRDSRKTLE